MTSAPSSPISTKTPAPTPITTQSAPANNRYEMLPLNMDCSAAIIERAANEEKDCTTIAARIAIIALPVIFILEMVILNGAKMLINAARSIANFALDCWEPKEIAQEAPSASDAASATTDSTEDEEKSLEVEEEKEAAPASPAQSAAATPQEELGDSAPKPVEPPVAEKAAEQALPPVADERAADPVPPAESQLDEDELAADPVPRAEAQLDADELAADSDSEVDEADFEEAAPQEGCAARKAKAVRSAISSATQKAYETAKRVLFAAKDSASSVSSRVVAFARHRLGGLNSSAAAAAPRQ